MKRNKSNIDSTMAIAILFQAGFRTYQSTSGITLMKNDRTSDDARIYRNGKIEIGNERRPVCFTGLKNAIIILN